MLKNKNFLTVILIASCVCFVFAARALKPNPESLLQKRNMERSKGNDKAPLWITEYFDYQCPPCANAKKVLDRVMAENPDKVYLQARYYPLPNHKNAMKAAIYAECSSRQAGKFWKFHEQLFEHQIDWAQDKYPTLKFSSYAEKAGLDLKALETCADDPSTEKFILDEKTKASELGVKITPSFFVNGKMAVGVKALEDEVAAFFEAQKK